MKRVLRVIGGIVGILMAVLVVAIGVVFVMSNAKLATVYSLPEVADIDIPTGDDVLVEGERMFISRGCGECHTLNGGGQVLIDDPALGRVVPVNLTSGEGGVADRYETSGDWLKSLRHGVRLDGTTLYVMPSHHFNHYKDEDFALIIAYMQTLEPVDNVLPEQHFGPVGRVLLLAESTNDLLPGAVIDHDNVEVWDDVEVAVSEEYGHYLARGMCVGCHSENLSGGNTPSVTIPVSNITFDESGLEGWTLEEFTAVLRNGVRPDETTVDPSMPWNIFGQLTDTEVEALYVYLQSIEPLAYDTNVTEENTVMYR